MLEKKTGFRILQKKTKNQNDPAVHVEWCDRFLKKLSKSDKESWSHLRIRLSSELALPSPPLISLCCHLLFLFLSFGLHHPLSFHFSVKVVGSHLKACVGVFPYYLSRGFVRACDIALYDQSIWCGCGLRSVWLCQDCSPLWSHPANGTVYSDCLPFVHLFYIYTERQRETSDGGEFFMIPGAGPVQRRKDVSCGV